MVLLLFGDTASMRFIFVIFEPFSTVYTTELRRLSTATCMSFDLLFLESLITVVAYKGNHFVGYYYTGQILTLFFKIFFFNFEIYGIYL